MQVILSHNHRTIDDEIVCLTYIKPELVSPAVHTSTSAPADSYVYDSIAVDDMSAQLSLSSFSWVRNEDEN